MIILLTFIAAKQCLMFYIRMAVGSSEKLIAFFFYSGKVIFCPKRL
jgi:hypothetical protein